MHFRPITGTGGIDFSNNRGAVLSFMTIRTRSLIIIPGQWSFCLTLVVSCDFYTVTHRILLVSTLGEHYAEPDSITEQTDQETRQRTLFDFISATPVRSDPYKPVSLLNLLSKNSLRSPGLLAPRTAIHLSDCFTTQLRRYTSTACFCVLMISSKNGPIPGLCDKECTKLLPLSMNNLSVSTVGFLLFFFFAFLILLSLLAIHSVLYERLSSLHLNSFKVQPHSRGFTHRSLEASVSNPTIKIYHTPKAGPMIAPMVLARSSRLKLPPGTKPHMIVQLLSAWFSVSYFESTNFNCIALGVGTFWKTKGISIFYWSGRRQSTICFL